ncbi:HAD-IIIC family phosphatase [Acidithiobacillus sp.]|uniref:HAD-IIIC family phosphatase n=1 Tax=Acidithiobacillus sp. TaxID=1872118 RepID=UPI0026341DFF|nr:HAD-IIIC family phosphatase [Acidithiobacillus sp.]MDD5280397.1 HAD-IIIC family phosphatase [Acidithiobacillus sp.]
MITNIGFRTPRDLEITPTAFRRILVIGSCLSEAFPILIPQEWPGVEVDWIALNNVGSPPEQTPNPVEEYDFQLLQIATRSIFQDREHLAVTLDTDELWEQLFLRVSDRLAMVVDLMMAYNKAHGLLTFFSNFLVPQQNPYGRLFPRRDMRNPVYFFEELNRELDLIIRKYPNAYILDVDSIASSLGKRYLNDDSMWILTHNSLYSEVDFLYDQDRIEKSPPYSEIFNSKAYDFILECLNELRASYRSVLGIDAVKLIVTDLDDTLWRGISGEWEESNFSDGWPNGIAEALAFLRQKGILLAVISKNDHEEALAHWSSILPPDFFSVLMINWEDKVTNMSKILATVNLLPHNTVYIDDNPIERENMRAAFPEMRIIGADPHLVRRTLLWSPETQSPLLTVESSRRVEMMSHQIEREGTRKLLSRDDFLTSLELALFFQAVGPERQQAFDRSLELINKTNQANTTGRRWRREEILSHLEDGGSMYAVTACDKYTEYGIISVIIASPGRFVQMVLSCRAFGLGIEGAIIAELGRHVSKPDEPLELMFQDTGRNKVAAEALISMGLKLSTDAFQIVNPENLIAPPHIAIHWQP